MAQQGLTHKALDRGTLLQHEQSINPGETIGWFHPLAGGYQPDIPDTLNLNQLLKEVTHD